MSSNKNNRWEWFESKNEWKIYDDKIKNILDDCLNNNKLIAKFTLNSIQFEVNLQTMMQKNLKTKYEREIRYCLRGNNKKDYYTWQWQDDNNKWSYYQANSVVHIENEYIKDNNGKFDLNVSNNVYSIDFKTMKQTNQKTSFSRNIKRIKSECELDELDDDENSVKNEESSQESVESSSSSSRKILPPRAAKQKSISLNNKENNKIKTIKEEPKIKNENDDTNDKKSDNKSVKIEKLKIKEEKKDSYDEEAEDSDSDDSKNRLKRKIVEKSDSKKGKRLKSAGKIEEENEDDDKDDDNDESKAKSSLAKTIKTIRYTGKVPVDETFVNTVSSEYHVYVESGDVYDCMLNQTNLQYNNNKYYLLQILKHNKKNQFCVWFRWGRVGKNGQSSSQNCGSDVNKAKAIFCEKFFDKTKNEWQNRNSFEKYPGKYDIVHKDYDSNDENEDEDEIKTEKKDESKSEKEVPKSKLEKPIQDLVEFLYDIQEMEAILKEMKYDIKKAPLGKLSSNQIKIGLEALEKIEDQIKNNDFGKALINACNDYYTRIPHDFGMRTPPVINTKALLKKEFVLLEALSDIEIAIKAINKKSEIENPIDRYYDELECAIKIVDTNDKMYKYIDNYLHKTHAPTHNTYEMEILNIYEINKENEKARFRKDLGNRMLLWHGSMRTNWAGILTTGLRVAAKTEEVSNGCMFGKACYFADCSSKSANYCYPDKQKNIAIIALCEVALGECNEIIAATGEEYSSESLPKNKSSTKGLGRSEPNKKEWITLEDGVIIPSGKLVPTGVNNPNGYTLLYNEYAVYNANQIKLRYLVKVKFEFNF